MFLISTYVLHYLDTFARKENITNLYDNYSENHKVFFQGTMYYI